MSQDEGTRQQILGEAELTKEFVLFLTEPGSFGTFGLLGRAYHLNTIMYTEFKKSKPFF